MGAMEIDSKKYIHYYFGSGVFEVLISIVFLLVIPKDPKNSWFLGYSFSRICFATLLLVAGFFHGWLLYKSFKEGHLIDLINNWILKLLIVSGYSVPVFIIVGSILIFGTFMYIFMVTPNLTTLRGYMLRLLPFVMLSFTRTSQTSFILLRLNFLLDQKKRFVHSNNKKTIFIRPKKVVMILGLIAIVLVLMSLSVGVISRITWDIRVFGLGPRFNLNREHNIPSFFSAILLLISGFLFAVIATLHHTLENSSHKYWFVLSSIFLFLSLDEATSIHEMFSDPLRELFNTGGVFYYAWILVAIPLIFIFVAFFWQFVKQISQPTKGYFIIAFLIFLSGAIVVEMIGGWYEGNFGDNNLLYDMITTFEESLEMSGVILLIYSLLDYIGTTFDQFSVNLVNQQEK
jgi:hypothetical protein